MEEKFRIINPEDIISNTFNLIGNEWMLITAGNLQKYNTMTASWGGFGVLWGKNVCFIVIRPQRYTYEFVEASGSFTLSFFDKDHKKALNYCGSHSGRNVDKAKETGITPIEDDPGTVYFKEANMVIVCRKIYFQDMDPANFIDPDIEKNYPGKDYHRMYVGEIEKCYLRKA